MRVKPGFISCWIAPSQHVAESKYRHNWKCKIRGRTWGDLDRLVGVIVENGELTFHDGFALCPYLLEERRICRIRSHGWGGIEYCEVLW